MGFRSAHRELRRDVHNKMHLQPIILFTHCLDMKQNISLVTFSLVPIKFPDPPPPILSIFHNFPEFSSTGKSEKLVIQVIQNCLIPPSHRRRGATEALVRHKLQWHRHDRCGSAVVPSLIAVAPRKTVKTADLRGDTAETLNMFKTSAVPPRAGPIRSGIAAAPP